MGRKQVKKSAKKLSSDKTEFTKKTQDEDSVKENGGNEDQLKCFKNKEYVNESGRKMPQFPSKGCESRIFPVGTEWLVFLVTLCLRVCYVSRKENWWILHPDEIFQSVEVAHSEVHGYGFRPYEYLPPPGENHTLSQIRWQEEVLGMYSLRSFLYPKFLMVSMVIIKLIGYDWSPLMVQASSLNNSSVLPIVSIVYQCPPGLTHDRGVSVHLDPVITSDHMVCKVVHAVVASFLPLSVYKFAVTLSRSHDVGIMAAILTSSSVHLTVFGTHTLTQSFISPFLFWSLAHLFEIVLNNDGAKLDKEDKLTGEFVNERGQCYKQGHSVVSVFHHSATAIKKMVTTLCGYCGFSVSVLHADKFQNKVKLNGHCTVYSKRLQTSTNMQQRQPYEPIGKQQNDFHQNHEPAGYKQIHLSSTKDLNHNLTKIRNVDIDEHDTQYCEMASSPPNTGINGTFNPKFRHKAKSNSPDVKKIVAGMVLGLCLYVRVDLVVFVALSVLTYLGDGFRNMKNWQVARYLLWFTCGILLGGSLGLLDDFNSYGNTVVTPWQWLKFNVFSNYSTALFGKQNLDFYVRNVLLYDIASVLSCVASCVYILYICLHNAIEDYLVKTNVKVFLSLIMNLILHSLNNHKEMRFLHNFIVYLFVFYSGIFVHFISIIYKTILTRCTFNFNIKRVLSATALMFFISSQWIKFPSELDQSNAKWTYKGITDSSHVNMCLDFIGQQTDVTGVYVDSTIHMTGGFATLHKDVPILSLVHKEFYEWDTDSRIILKPSTKFVNRISVNILSQVSDFISIYNTPYLLKVLVEKQKYNYLVMKSDREFVNVGYTEIYRSGTMKVLQRTFDPDSEQTLFRMVKHIQPGTSVQVLNYESNWLLTFALYKKAEEKLLHSLSISKNNVSAFRLLMEVYLRQGRGDIAKKVFRQCVQDLEYNMCADKMSRLVLHEEYKLNVGL